MISKEVLQYFIEQDLSSYKIAEKLNTTRAIIQYWMDYHGLKTNHKARNKPSNYESKFLCNKCGETNLDKFYSTKRKLCKSCSIKNQAGRKNRGKNKERLIEYKGGKCERCGYNKCVAALSFHHRDPTEKDPNAARYRTWSFERAKKEIDKCDLLCMNCHLEEHWG